MNTYIPATADQLRIIKKSKNVELNGTGLVQYPFASLQVLKQ